MPFLARYAAMKRLSPEQLMAWVNALSPGQVRSLALSLRQAAEDCRGDPGQFTAGPARTRVIASGGLPVQFAAVTTVAAFEQRLASDHVPHP
jgi:hypothetical protein